MSLILEKSQISIRTNVAGKHGGLDPERAVVLTDETSDQQLFLADEDFVSLVKFVLTNTNLAPGFSDLRPGLCRWVANLQIGEGWGGIGVRLVPKEEPKEDPPVISEGKGWCDE